MSLRAAQTCDERVFQYCNYGYDRKKYSSLEDCMTKEKLKCNNVSMPEYKLPNPQKKFPNTAFTEEERAAAINFENKVRNENNRRKNMTIVLIVGVAIIGIYFAKKKKLI